MTRTDLAYRKSAAEAVSGIEPLIALYDTLAGDLRRAAQAQRSENIEVRCREIRHALLVIGFLEDWVRRGEGGALADKLMHFYASLRKKLIQAGTRKSAQMMEEQMDRVLALREQWQRMELRIEISGPEIMQPEMSGHSHHMIAPMEHRRGSWSA